MRLDLLTTVNELNSCIVFVAVVIVDALIYTVIFLTGPPLKMSLDWPPPKRPRLAPPCFGKVLSMAAEKGEIPNTLTFSIPMGGQSGTLMFF